MGWEQAPGFYWDDCNPRQGGCLPARLPALQGLNQDNEFTQVCGDPNVPMFVYFRSFRGMYGMANAVLRLLQMGP